MSKEAIRLAIEHIQGNYTVSADDAIKALKEALAKQEHGEPVGVMVSMDVSKGDEPEHRIFGRIYELQEDSDGVTYLAIEDSRNFEAKQEQGEPVAWTLLLVGEHNGIVGKAGKTFEGHPEYYRRVDVYTKPPPKQELVCVCGAVWEGNEIVSSPQQRTWVGLTDEEIRSVEFDHIRRRDYARAIEAKLKEKNT